MRGYVLSGTEVARRWTARGGGNNATRYVAVNGGRTAGDNFRGLDGVAREVDATPNLNTVDEYLVAVLTSSTEGYPTGGFVRNDGCRHLQKTGQSALRQVPNDFLVKGLSRFTGLYQRSFVLCSDGNNVQFVGFLGHFHRQYQRATGRNLGAAQFVGLHAKSFDSDGVGTFVHRRDGEVAVEVRLALGFHRFAVHDFNDGVGNSIA